LANRLCALDGPVVERAIGLTTSSSAQRELDRVRGILHVGGDDRVAATIDEPHRAPAGRLDDRRRLWIAGPPRPSRATSSGRRRTSQMPRIRSHTELMRREAWSGMVEHLRGRFGLAAGIEVRRAVDLLMLVMSPMSYHTLVNEYGWSDDQWRAWCTSAISLQLFDNPA
jgi:hypothetical protein